MKSGSLVKPILLSSIFFLLMLSLLVSSITALGVYPLCLTKGQIVRFSLCNPTIVDRVCTKALCQYCISESSPGIYCPASLNACNTGSQECVYLSNPTPTQVRINITLTEPINNYNITVTSTNSISFKFKVTNSSLLSSCNLFINEAQVSQNQTKISSSINTIQVNVNPSSPGNYIWYIRCTNKSGSSFYSENRNLIISPNSTSNNNNSTNSTNSTSPVFYNVNALTPQNQSLFSEGIVSFSYNLSNLSSTTLKTCNLIIDGNIVNSTNSTSTPGISNRENIISQNLSAGSYYWNINCISKVSNPSKNYSSEKRLITVTSNTPTNPTDGGNTGGGSSGGGGGGGGGSYSSSQPICLSSVWNCTKWTACKNSTQTRVCTLTRTDCKAQTKPEESVKCIQANANNNQDNNNSNNANASDPSSSTSENNPKVASGITGAFIGSLSNQKVWLPIVIIIAIVILLIIIQLIRKFIGKK